VRADGGVEVRYAVRLLGWRNGEKEKGHPHRVWVGGPRVEATEMTIAKRV